MSFSAGWRHYYWKIYWSLTLDFLQEVSLLWNSHKVKVKVRLWGSFFRPGVRFCYICLTGTSKRGRKDISSFNLVLICVSSSVCRSRIHRLMDDCVSGSRSCRCRQLTNSLFIWSHSEVSVSTNPRGCLKSRSHTDELLSGWWLWSGF